MKDDIPECLPQEHLIHLSCVSDIVLEDTVSIFSAMADTARLNLLILLYECGECCVSELAEQLHEKVNTISMRLKKLYDAGLVDKRREAKHILYQLKDTHVVTIIQNAINHAQHHRTF